MTKITKLPIAALLLSPVLALAAVPPTVTFSARIADDGRPVTGPHAFTFTLWNVETGGVAGTNDVWTEGPRIIQVNDGVVATALGDVPNGGVALPRFDGTPLWLEVTMGTVTFPRRIAIHSVPYALSAPVTCTRVSQTMSIAASGSSGAAANCPATHPTVVSGGWFSGGATINVYDNGPYNYGTGDYWFVGASNPGVSAVSVTVYARCCQ